MQEPQPGLKAKDIKPCSFCKKGVMKNGHPMFYRISMEMHCVELKAVQRTHGLEEFFGGGPAGAMLANVMGDDPDITKKISLDTKTICLACAQDPMTAFAQLLESEEEDDSTEATEPT